MQRRISQFLPQSLKWMLELVNEMLRVCPSIVRGCRRHGGDDRLASGITPPSLSLMGQRRQRLFNALRIWRFDDQVVAIPDLLRPWLLVTSPFGHAANPFNFAGLGLDLARQPVSAYGHVTLRLVRQITKSWISHTLGINMNWNIEYYKYITKVLNFS